jgi:uncharacterized protein
VRLGLGIAEAAPVIHSSQRTMHDCGDARYKPTFHWRPDMRSLTLAAAIAAAFFAISPAWAQTDAPPPADNLTAARDLVQVLKPTDQFKAMLPVLFQNFKAAVVQGRPEVEKQYDAMIPMFNQSAERHLSELTDTFAAIYARNFTVDELHQMAAFYQSPAGQKLLQKQPDIARESLAAGQHLAQEVMADVQRQMQDAH